MTGYVADTLLPGLYGAADVCLYPSLYEGFGLPVLEALSCGCPVICSNTSSLPEVAGNAAILLPPNDEGIWAERIGELLLSADMRTQMGRAGLAQAAHFDWKTTAERTLGVYNHVYARHRP
jgi:alpha-1,3-rhamnosyl/mannosyltransferase